jgi:DNA-binding response OmpR family regulator/anti-sigma regulatory factor (Ser/Thr protein kinase)
VDRQKMEIALFNLLSNAIKFTPEGGSIIFSVCEKEEEVEVTVTDSGYGIPQEAASRLFEKFYQARSVNAPVKSGFGIGLYLVRHFVEGHKGAITFQSREGEGTSFLMRLKKGSAHLDQQAILHQPDEEPVFLEELEEEVVPGPDENKLGELVSDRQTILVVDDDHAIRQYIIQFLKDKYQILEADNGSDALKLANRKFPDLVISDIRMEGMDGLELCRSIKKDPSLNHIPVILLTGSFASGTELESLEGGADAYITKPFDKDILLARIENIFKSRNELQQYFFNEITLKKNTLKISSEYKEFLEKCIVIVEAHLEDDQFTIKKLSQEIGMSHSNLYKKVKSISGQSVNSFIRFIRLRKAAEILILTDCNVNQAAFQVGINDIKYFRVQFNKLFGMNPSEYIKKYRNSFDKSYHLSSSAVKEKPGK